MILFIKICINNIKQITTTTNKISITFSYNFFRHARIERPNTGRKSTRPSTCHAWPTYQKPAPRTTSKIWPIAVDVASFKKRTSHPN